MSAKSELQPLLKLSFFFALIPSYDTGCTKWWKLRSYITCALFICVIAFCNYKIFPCLFTKRSSFVVLFFLIHAVNTVFYLSHFVRMTRMEQGFRNLLKTFDVIDDGLVKLMGIKMKYKSFVFWHISLITVTFVLEIIGNYLTWLDDPYLFKYLIYDDVQIYLDAIITILEFHLLKNIMFRFKNLGDALDTMVPMQSRTFLINWIETLTDVHGNIADTIDFYNYFFCWHILYKQIIVTLNILEVVELVIIKEFANWYSLCFALAATAYAYLQTFILITLYENIKEKGVTANTLALKVLHGHSSDELVSRKLSILVQQINTRIPLFTAAGYFNVDYNMIFSFINITMTYVIVLIQSTK